MRTCCWSGWHYCGCSPGVNSCLDDPAESIPWYKHAACRWRGCADKEQKAIKTVIIRLLQLGQVDQQAASKKCDCLEAVLAPQIFPNAVVQRREKKSRTSITFTQNSHHSKAFAHSPPCSAERGYYHNGTEGILSHSCPVLVNSLTLPTVHPPSSGPVSYLDSLLPQRPKPIH
jgi:hypothetical protein